MPFYTDKHTLLNETKNWMKQIGPEMGCNYSYLYCSWRFSFQTNNNSNIKKVKWIAISKLSISKKKKKLWNTQHTWITNKPYRRFFALHYSSDGCMPWQWAILATRTFVVRFVDFHDYCCTTVSYRIKRVFSLQVIARFVLIVVLMWPQLLGSLFL